MFAVILPLYRLSDIVPVLGRSKVPPLPAAFHCWRSYSRKRLMPKKEKAVSRWSHHITHTGVVQIHYLVLLFCVFINLSMTLTVSYTTSNHTVTAGERNAGRWRTSGGWSIKSSRPRQKWRRYHNGSCEAGLETQQHHRSPPLSLNNRTAAVVGVVK